MPRTTEYVVKDIVAHQHRNGKLFFQVRWEGYSDADNTWEPEHNLANSPNKINQYLKANKCSTTADLPRKPIQTTRKRAAPRSSAPAAASQEPKRTKATGTFPKPERGRFESGDKKGQVVARAGKSAQLRAEVNNQEPAEGYDEEPAVEKANVVVEAVDGPELLNGAIDRAVNDGELLGVVQQVPVIPVITLDDDEERAPNIAAPPRIEATGDAAQTLHEPTRPIAEEVRQTDLLATVQPRSVSVEVPAQAKVQAARDKARIKSLKVLLMESTKEKNLLKETVARLKDELSHQKGIVDLMKKKCTDFANDIQHT